MFFFRLIYQGANDLFDILLEQREMPFIGIKFRLTLRNSCCEVTSHLDRDVLINLPVPDQDRHLNILQAEAPFCDCEQGLMICPACSLSYGFAHHTDKTLLEDRVRENDLAVRLGKDG